MGINQDYPVSRIDDGRDSLAGLSFPDPYRWLESESQEVSIWQRAQAELASHHVRQWPHFDRLRRWVAHFGTEHHFARTVPPRYAASRWFRAQTAQGQSQARALVSDEPMGSGRVLFDPFMENRERPPFLSWMSPSPDGRTLALGVCDDGSENNRIRLVDVSSGHTMSGAPTETLMDSMSGGAQWLPDSSGFFFSAITGSAIDFDQQVYFHCRAPLPTTRRLDIPWSGTKGFRWIAVSRDGCYAIAYELSSAGAPVALAPLGQGALRWRPFVTGVAGTVAGHLVGDRYLAVTDVGAPRGRLVAIALESKTPGDPGSWDELVSESNAVLRAATLVGETLYLTELVDTYARVRIVDLHGRPLGEVPLPGRGAVGTEWSYSFLSMFPKGHPKKFLFTFSSLTVSSGTYSHTPGQDAIEILQDPKARIDHAVIEDRRAISPDGTSVPYQLVRRLEVTTERPRPTLIYAYGESGSPLLPEFPGPMAAFVAVGGLYILAHVRGGGEFGLAWSQGGRMKHKQNCCDDLYAIAEDLIAGNLCTRDSLAVTGESYGGLLAGLAAIQRPELWAVAIPRVPTLDLIGACRYPYGRLVASGLANVDDPEEIRRLEMLSPYHLVRDGIRYPAVFLDAGDTDVRSPPWHARKFAARLQRASTGGAPVLLHVWENVGHGPATDPHVAIMEHTEWLAFTLQQLHVEELPDFAPEFPQP